MIFNISVKTNGDCCNRYLVRVLEMYESLRIIEQYLNQISTGSRKSNDNKIIPPSRYKIKQSMESLIPHFEMYTQSFTIPANEIYRWTEAPKGEFDAS
jgi:NADH-quinone oxidoreductase subunit D